MTFDCKDTLHRHPPSHLRASPIFSFYGVVNPARETKSFTQSHTGNQEQS